MKLKALMFATVTMLTGCNGTPEQLIGNLSAFRCEADVCTVVIQTKGWANDPIHQEVISCSKADELAKLAGRKIIVFKSNKGASCMTTYEYVQL